MSGGEGSGGSGAGRPGAGPFDVMAGRSPLPRVAFLGLGTMGAPMAAHLARAGVALTVWNRSLEKARAFAALHKEAHGIALAESPAAAAASADVVITMLSDPPALEAVMGGPAGVLSALAAGSTLIDMSTVDPATSRRLAVLVEARGARFLDVPVVGSRRPAEAGTLLLLAGGAPGDLERVRVVLEPMGRILAAGPVGAGAALKLVCNSLGAHMLVGLASALVFARACGLDPQLAFEAIQRSAFAAPGHAAKAERILAGDFGHADFPLRLMKKDQDLALRTAAAAGLELPTLQAIVGLVDGGMALGFGDEDLAAVVRPMEAQSGLAARRGA